MSQQQILPFWGGDYGSLFFGGTVLVCDSLRIRI